MRRQWSGRPGGTVIEDLRAHRGPVYEETPPPDDRRVRAACRWLTADPRVDIGTVAQRFEWNVRAIRREFHAACG